MKTIYTLAISFLNGIGVKTTMSIVEYALSNKIEIKSPNELHDFLSLLYEKQLIKRLNQFQKSDIDNVIGKADKLQFVSFNYYLFV